VDSFGIVGTTLDQKFQVVEPVGEGGFGVVYRGVHLALEQPIAIKCLRIPPHFGADALERFVEQFRSEGKHLARLSQHPSIVRVHDLGVTHGAKASAIPYLVTVPRQLRARARHRWQLRSFPSGRQEPSASPRCGLTLSAGVQAMVLIALTRAQWDSSKQIDVAIDGIGAFENEGLTGPALVVITPGIGLRYDI
jgi:serine/threonine protein kinase